MVKRTLTINTVRPITRDNERFLEVTMGRGRSKKVIQIPLTQPSPRGILPSQRALNGRRVSYSEQLDGPYMVRRYEILDGKLKGKIYEARENKKVDGIVTLTEDEFRGQFSGGPL